METFKPILFSTQMVQALGTKNQTRRIVKEHIVLKEGEFIDTCEGWKKQGDFAIKEKAPGYPDRWIIHQVLKNKYSKGDILWVRETFQDAKCFDFNMAGFVYKADKHSNKHAQEYNINWQPSIYMPKEAARNFLQVIKVRIERLNKITEEDAIGEGILVDEDGYTCWDYSKNCWGPFGFTPQESFKTLWESIHGTGTWGNNPWVWVYDFFKISKPINFC